MNYFKLQCDKVIPFLLASSRGEVVQASCDNGNYWFDLSDCEMSDPALQFDFSNYDYRIKPSTIKIGDFDVPEPMREIPTYGDIVFTVEIDDKRLCGQTTWNGLEFVSTMLERGLLHKSKDDAITHAKALIALTSAK